MLAKVVKSNSAQNYPAFSLPEIAAADLHAAKAAQFIEPAAIVQTFSAAPVNVETKVGKLTETEEILQNARREATRIIARAEEQSAVIVEIAREKAVREVEARFDEEFAAKTAELRLQFTETLAQIASLSGEIANRLEKDLVKLTLPKAKKDESGRMKDEKEIIFTCSDQINIL